MSFLRKLTAQKPPETSECNKKWYQYTCVAGGAVALLSMLIALIVTRGTYASYTWSALLLGFGSAAFYALAYLRYSMPENRLLARFSDASVYLTVFSAHAPIQLILIRAAMYENGSIVAGWVTFGVVGFLSLLFFIASLCSTHKFRLFGSFIYLVTAFSPLFGIFSILTAYTFAPVLGVILMAVSILAFAATPIIFWFFDKKEWQMKVFYILMAVGTFAASLMTLLYLFINY